MTMMVAMPTVVTVIHVGDAGDDDDYDDDDWLMMPLAMLVTEWPWNPWQQMSILDTNFLRLLQGRHCSVIDCGC